ncbi:hypothetical protein VTI74DRAFT_4214 [Chaetomium olivicolor]
MEQAGLRGRPVYMMAREIQVAMTHADSPQRDNTRHGRTFSTRNFTQMTIRQGKVQPVLCFSTQLLRTKGYEVTAAK